MDPSANYGQWSRRLLWLPLIILTVISYAGIKSDQRPMIGMECPDFKIRHMQNVMDSTLTKNDLKGRFVILEFWSNGCSVCVSYFPELEALHREFKDQITFILIGTEDKQQRMRPLYEKLRVKRGMTVPFAFDSLLFNSFVPRVVPHLLWIDDKGVVRAITNAGDLNADNVRSFKSGQTFSFYNTSHEAAEDRQSLTIDFNQPILDNGNGGSAEKYISRSLLVPADPDRMTLGGMPMNIEYFVNHNDNNKRGLFQGSAFLEMFYKFAYTGYPTWLSRDPVYTKFYPRCIIEVHDKTPFYVDGASLQGFYWYSLYLPDQVLSEEKVLTSMQQDLSRSFGYEVTVEKRKMPCRILTSTRQARRALKTTHGSNANDHVEAAEVILTNISMKKLIALVFYKHIENEPPIFDRTGIKHQFDINLHADIYNLEDIRRELKRVGLVLKEGKKRMKVIVIRDPE